VGFLFDICTALQAIRASGGDIFRKMMVLEAFASLTLSEASLLYLMPFSSKSVSSSPDRAISVMISQPPTNSPLT
jgi:hypothetical protein